MWNITSDLIARSGSGLLDEGAACSRAGMFTTAEFGWKKSPLKTTAALSGLGIASAIASKNKDIAAFIGLLTPALMYGACRRTNKILDKQAAKKLNTPLKKTMTMVKRHRIPLAFGVGLGIIGSNLLAPDNKNDTKKKE